MRLPFSCMECAISGNIQYPVYVELRDDGRYEFTCEQGHKTITIVQQQRFEILFDLGAYAIVDGYYRDAVASFASSLERFYEFFIQASFLEDGMDYPDFKKTWKVVASQSERQLGAFIFLYLKSFSSEPPILKNVSFRNKVIHQGKIPSREEAIDFGNEVLAIIRPTLKLAKAKFPKGVQQSVFHQIIGSHKPDESQPVGTMSIPTILSLTNNDATELSLQDALAEKQWWRDRWQKSS